MFSSRKFLTGKTCIATWQKKSSAILPNQSIKLKKKPNLHKKPLVPPSAGSSANLTASLQTQQVIRADSWCQNPQLEFSSWLEEVPVWGHLTPGLQGASQRRAGKPACPAAGTTARPGLRHSSSKLKKKLIWGEKNKSDFPTGKIT